MELRLTSARERLEAVQLLLEKRYGLPGRIYASRADKSVRLYFRIDDDAVDSILDDLAAPDLGGGREKGASS